MVERGEIDEEFKKETFLKDTSTGESASTSKKEIIGFKKREVKGKVK